MSFLSNIGSQVSFGFSERYQDCLFQNEKEDAQDYKALNHIDNQTENKLYDSLKKALRQRYCIHFYIKQEQTTEEEDPEKRTKNIQFLTEKNKETEEQINELRAKIEKLSNRIIRRHSIDASFSFKNV